MDYINIENDCDLDSNGLVPWMTIRAGQPSKFDQIRMVGSLYDKNGMEILGGGSGSITEYSVLFVNSAIAQSAPPVYKTIQEVAVIVKNNTTVAYDVKIMTDVTVTTLLEFKDGTRVFGVGPNIKITILNGGILNFVSEWNNIRFDINLTATTFNLFNNIIPNHKFINCTFADDGAKNAPVYVLLGGELNFTNCVFEGFTGPNKDFINATSGLLSIEFIDTVLPQTALCLFKFTDPTIGYVNLLGATEKRTIVANCTGNFTTVLYQNLEDHGDVTITNPINAHALMYYEPDATWKNRKIVMNDLETVNLDTMNLTSAMTLSYDPIANEWNNKYTSESATVHTIYTDIEPPDPLKVPAGQVMFLDISNVPIGEAANAVKVFVSFYNQSGVNLYGTGYLEGITQGSSKYKILVKSLVDSGEYLRAYIVDSLENAILEQWELTISVPTSTSVFTLNTAVAVSIEHYPLLEKMLDVNYTLPLSSGEVLKWDGAQWTNGSDNTSLISGEGTGFLNPESAIMTYNIDLGSRSIILMGAFTAYWKGTPISVMNGGFWQSPEHPVFTGNYYLWYDGDGFYWSESLPDYNVLQIAYVTVQPFHHFGIRQCHGFTQWQTSRDLHKNVGVSLVSGGSLSSYVLDSTTVDDRRPNVAETVLLDGDSRTTNLQLLKTDNAGNPYTWFYWNGTTPTVVASQSGIIMIGGMTSAPQYNLDLGAHNYTTTDFLPNTYGKIFVLAIPVTSDDNSLQYRYVFINPQQNSNSLTTIQAVKFSDLYLGSFLSSLPEFLPVAEIIISYPGIAGWTLHSVSSLSGSSIIQTLPLLTSVSTDNTTVIGSGLPANPLHTPSYSWKYWGTYDHGIAVPVLDSGEFAIDATNRYLLVKHSDSNAVSHQDLLLSIEFLSQIVLKISETKRNRYCIEQLTDDVPNTQIEYSWQNDTKLTVLEEIPGNLVLAKTYELEFIRTPGTNLDALADVAITAPVDGQLLQYDTILGWNNVDSLTPMASMNWSGSQTLTLTTQNDWYNIEWAGFTFSANTNDWDNVGVNSSRLEYLSISKPTSFVVHYNFNCSSATATETVEFKLQWLNADLTPASEVWSFHHNDTVDGFGGHRLILYPVQLNPAYLTFNVRCTSANGLVLTFKKLDIVINHDRI